MKRYIMALDQGTTSSRCIIFDKDESIIASAQREITPIFPTEGWVEQDATEIWESQLAVAKEALAKAGLSTGDIAAIGITNQRETTVVWEKNSGKPIAPAIVWQCRRTAPYCEELKKAGYNDMVVAKTGLRIDAYFSASKLRWILENVPGAREKAENDEILFGTVDSWLLWNLTGGKVHATDYSNACRTLLFNIHTLNWDEELTTLFDIPRSLLPKACPNSTIYGETTLFGAAIPIAGIGGDQQCALFGQRCFGAGDVKNTYGTGCFMLMNTGKESVSSNHGLLTTVAWDIGDGPVYALEGSVFVAGAAIQWLRDEMKLIPSAADSEEVARSVPDNGGVYVVPAFVGLGAPYWDSEARGIITGLSRGSTARHIVRATVESLAYQTNDVLTVMGRDASPITSLRVDGGAAHNDFLMAFQADISNTEVIRPHNIEATALGAAYFAGLAVDFWSSPSEIATVARPQKLFSPALPRDEREKLLRGWAKAITQAKA